MIPIVIICYNNYKYVENTINQIIKINPSLRNDVIIMNNNSTDINTINYLSQTDIKIVNRNNEGPWINDYYNRDFYYALPQKFVLTDPDLEFNENLPSNFIDILSELSDKYGCYKIGFALDRSDKDKMWICCDGEDIYWENKVSNSDYEMYYADIDTTFCLVNKHNGGPIIRMAGNFTAKHIPWYKENKIINIYEQYKVYKDAKFSSIKQEFLNFVDKDYCLIKKREEEIFIKNNISDINLNFWKNNYSYWDENTINVLDKYLKKDKIFIDIGGWIGTTCIYGSRKSKHVYVVEADKESLIDLSENCKNNSDNVTIIDKAIYNINDIDINFGKNIFSESSSLNDSTSHIHEIKNDSSYLCRTITINKLIEDYNINIKDISLIKVDIEGGEENILEDLYNFHKNYNVPIYISFHLWWWKDHNIKRFSFLNEFQINYISQYPFESLLFGD